MQDPSPELERLARRYVWWDSPEGALKRRDVLICQILQLGTWEDVRLARRLFGDPAFKEALANAPAGVLDAKSWSYWHRFFGITPVPSLPERPLP